MSKIRTVLFALGYCYSPGCEGRKSQPNERDLHPAELPEELLAATITTGMAVIGKSQPIVL